VERHYVGIETTNVYVHAVITFIDCARTRTVPVAVKPVFRRGTDHQRP
jgi:hypothetical protein